MADENGLDDTGDSELGGGYGEPSDYDLGYNDTSGPGLGGGFGEPSDYDLGYDDSSKIGLGGAWDELEADLLSGNDFGGLSADLEGFATENLTAALMDPEVSIALTQMSLEEQNTFLSSIVDPAIDTYYGLAGQLGEKVMGAVINSLLSAFCPGLGTLASLTGVTGKVTNYITDRSFNNTLGMALGLPNYGTPPGFGEDKIGDYESQIIQKIVEGIQRDGAGKFFSDLNVKLESMRGYNTYLSRRRSNIIGTGRRGLTIE
jgi:hypothetical protein